MGISNKNNMLIVKFNIYSGIDMNKGLGNIKIINVYIE